jgi:Family of unknown function (DUF5343)
MTHDLPYTPAYGKIATLFDKIAKAKIPDAFTVKYLNQSLGLKSTNDRNLIPLLKKLGFIDGSGKPTAEYSKLKGNKATVGAAVAESLTKAYSPLYEANEKAHDLPPDQLKGLIAQVSGAEDSLIGFIVGTFKNLVKLADFSATPSSEEEPAEEENGNGKPKKDNEQRDEADRQRNAFRPDFRFNIEIHLPSNGTEDTYLAIFNALRKSLG